MTDVRPMKQSELNKHRCTLDCMLRPNTTVAFEGLWVKVNGTWAAVHTACYHASKDADNWVFTMRSVMGLRPDDKPSEDQWEVLKIGARKLGEQHGGNAAEWVRLDNEETARWWVKGIDDGDPQVMDQMPDHNLSGEYADDYVADDLYRDLGIVRQHDSDDLELQTAYGDAFDSAVQSEVERRARALLEP